MNSDFSRLPHALGLAKATARNMKQNIFIAVGGCTGTLDQSVLQRLDEYVHRYVGPRRQHPGGNPERHKRLLRYRLPPAAYVGLSNGEVDLAQGFGQDAGDIN